MNKRKTIKRKSKKLAFWRDIKFKYKLTIINESTLEEVVGIRVSKLNGISVLLSALTVLFVLAALIITFTPLRNYLPGYMNSEVRAQVVDNALRADSLQLLLDRQNLYMANIKAILTGEIKADTVHSIDSLTALRGDSLMEVTRREEAFRKQYEEQERYNLSNPNPSNNSESLIFFPPVRGLVMTAFNAESRHWGIELAPNPSESVIATLDGVVMLSGYTTEGGYMVMIQHSRGFVSVYKWCRSLNCKEGDRVKAGQVIAQTMGKSEKSKSPYFTFELWQEGRAVNPEHYILF